MRFRLFLVVLFAVTASLLAGCSCHGNRDLPGARGDGGTLDHPVGNVKAVIQLSPPSIPQGDNFVTTVSFDGSMSAGMGGLTYQWDIGAGHLASGALTDAKITATFAGDNNAAVSLLVKDDLGTNATAAIVRIARAPIALLSAEMVTEVGTDLVVDGSLSAARDKQPLTFSWSSSNPAVSLTDSDKPKAHFKATVPGDMLVVLTVKAGTLSASARMMVHVLPALADQRPLEATLTVLPANPAIGENVTMTVVAPEAGPDVSVDFGFAGVHKIVAGTTLSTTFPASGNFPVIATVSSLGRWGRARAPLTVYDPGIADDGQPPVVALSTPAEQAIVSKRTDATGTAQDSDLAAYYLEARAQGAPNETSWTQLSKGTTSVSNGVLGKVETTLLPPGDYTLRLRAVDLRGHEASTTVPISVQAPNMGQVTFTIDDVHARFPGVPLVVRRTYNSGAGTKGDFGWNWSMSSTGNGQIHTTGPVGEGWTFSGNCVFSATLTEQRQHIVTIKTGGNTDYYQYAPKFAGCISGGAMFYAAFQPATRNKGSLHVEGEGDELIVLSGDNKMYRFEDLGEPVPTQIYEPKNWDLTNPDKSKLHFEKGKLTNVRDIRGNGVDVKDDEVVHTSGAKMKFTRNADKLITAIIRPDNKERTYTYNTSQELIAGTDFDGHVLHYVYGPDHQLFRIIDARGVVVYDVRYDDAGRLGQVLSDNGTSFAYDPEALTQTETSGSGGVHTLKYDEEGHAVEEKLNGRIITATTYDPKGFPTQRTDAQGRTASLQWNSDGAVTGRTDSEGHSLTLVPDGVSGKPVSMTDQSGGTIALTRDPDGEVTKVTGANGASYGITRDQATGETTSLSAGGTTTSFGRDSYGHVTSISAGGTQYTVATDIMGNSTGIEYSQDGHLYHVENDIDQDGTPIATRASVDGALISTAKAEQDPDGVYSTDSSGGKLVRDAKGKPLALVKPNGSVTTSTFYPDGRLENDASGEGNGTHYTYDDKALTVTAVSSNGSTTVSTRDAVGHVTKTVRDGMVRTYEYDEKGNRTAETGPLGTTRTTYDGNGLKTAVELPNGSKVVNGYDNANRLVSVQTDGKPAMKMDRDAQGNVTKITSPQGVTQNRAYDASGKMTSIAFGALPATMLSWNGDKIASLTDGNGHTRSYGSGTFGSVATETLASGKKRSSTADPSGKTVVISGFDGKKVTVDHDASGRATASTADDGTKVSFDYDSEDKIIAMHDAAGDTSFARDGGGNIVLVLRPDGRAVRATYDTVGTTSVVTASGKDEFVRDGKGQVTLVHASGVDVAIERSPTEGPTKWTAGSVVIDRVVSGSNTSGLHVSGTGGQQLWAEDYTYDSDGVATTVVGKSGTLTIAYDEGRKLTQFGNDSYTYDAGGNITAMSGGASRSFTFDVDDRLLTGGKESFTYDDAGRLTSVKGDREMNLTWDGLDRLTKVHTGGTLGAHDITYGYEADGLMVERTEDGTRRHFAWRHDSGLALLVEEYDDAGHALAHTTRAAGVIVRHVGDRASVLSTDVFGNVRLVTEGGAITDERTYSAYGELRSGKISLDQPFGFAGEWTDPTTGLVFMRARHYDPITARFVSRDPVDPRPEQPVSTNAYHYAADAPTIFHDPTGGQDLISMMAVVANIAVQLQMSPVFNILGSLLSSVYALRMTNQALSKSGILKHMGKQYQQLPTDLILPSVSATVSVLGQGAVTGAEILAQISLPFPGAGWTYSYFGAPGMESVVASSDASGNYNAANWDKDFGSFLGYGGGGLYGAQGGFALTGAVYGGLAFDANHPRSYEGAFAAISGFPPLVALMLIDAIIEQAFNQNQNGLTVGEIVFGAFAGLFSLEALFVGYSAELVAINALISSGGFMQFAFSPTAGASNFCNGAGDAELCYESQAWSITGGASKSVGNAYASVLTFFSYSFTWYQCPNVGFCEGTAPKYAPLAGMQTTIKP